MAQELMANDKRATPRTPIDAKARLFLLSSHDGPGLPIPARVVDASPSGLRLLLPHAIPPGTPVRIDVHDAMLLGEICYCAPVPSHPALASYAGVAIEQCLSGLASLQHLIDALRPATVPAFELR
jgi:hypothetical protein